MEEEEERTAAAEAVEAREPGVFRLRGRGTRKSSPAQCTHTHARTQRGQMYHEVTNTHTRKTH